MKNDKNQVPRILVVEDLAMIRQLVKTMCESFDVSVDLAANGHEAVSHASRQKYSLILMDRKMMGMDGLEATRLIRRLEDASLRSVPIVAMTGDSSEPDREACLGAGMNGFLFKPFGRSELGAVLQHWLGPKTESNLSQDSLVTVQPPPPDVLDIRQLETLASSLPGRGPALVRQIIDMFPDTIWPRLEVLRQALVEQDWRRVDLEAHALKAAVGYYGATQVTRICVELETLARAEDLEQGQERLESLTVEVSRLRDALASLRPRFAK